LISTFIVKSENLRKNKRAKLLRSRRLANNVEKGSPSDPETNEMLNEFY
jgi:hypothetical protein